MTTEPDPEVNTVENPKGAYLEFGALALDRKNMTAYCALSTRASKEVAELWARILGYDLVLFNFASKTAYPHTTHVFFIGSGVFISE